MSNDLPPKIRSILGDLAPGERNALLAALADPEDTAQRIHEVLTKHGVDVGYTSLKVARKAMIA